MSATTIFAKRITTDKLVHIDDASKSHHFTCPDCGADLIVVKSQERKRDWHFRHHESIICNVSRDTTLHNFAVQTLLDSNSIKVKEELVLNYIEPRKEVSFLNYRSDVTILYNQESVHIEVFVTHDITPEKIKSYIANNLKCIRIDLSDPKLLSASVGFPVIRPAIS